MKNILKPTRNLEEQTKGQLIKDDFYPIPSIVPFSNFVESFTQRAQYKMSPHFACGMATYVFKEDDGSLKPITRFIDVDGFLEFIDERAEALKQGSNKYVTGLRMLTKINSFIEKKEAPKGFNVGKLLYNSLIKHDYKALGEFHYRTLFVGMMHFQDPYNYDIQRVERCVIHYVQPDKSVIPFCAFNILPGIYRDKVQNKYAMAPEEWERKTGKKLADDVYRRKV